MYIRDVHQPPSYFSVCCCWRLPLAVVDQQVHLRQRMGPLYRHPGRYCVSPTLVFPIALPLTRLWGQMRIRLKSSLWFIVGLSDLMSTYTSYPIGPRGMYH